MNGYRVPNSRNHSKGINVGYAALLKNKQDLTVLIIISHLDGINLREASNVRRLRLTQTRLVTVEDLTGVDYVLFLQSAHTTLLQKRSVIMARKGHTVVRIVQSSEELRDALKRQQIAPKARLIAAPKPKKTKVYGKKIRAAAGSIGIVYKTIHFRSHKNIGEVLSRYVSQDDRKKPSIMMAKKYAHRVKHHGFGECLTAIATAFRKQFDVPVLVDSNHAMYELALHYLKKEGSKSTSSPEQLAFKYVDDASNYFTQLSRSGLRSCLRKMFVKAKENTLLERRAKRRLVS